jgi:lipopolysaccharide transport system ATP-binding protein
MTRAINVEGISKLYQLGPNQHTHYRTLRESIADAAGAPWRFLARKLRGASPSAERPVSKSLWALKDVSFDVKPGDTVGIIGRNGAGKSTLLKILSRITEPTSGRIKIRGRVASLLEVGTGFHQELTGRENIYLNGCILGMSRRQIDRRFDEIVEFANISDFLDTPVKRYSSGMYVRLAFAVAAHQDPDVFIVDEVLAVGDAEFQRKCLGKMSDVASSGRTVLFVSHNMPAVQKLCSRGVVLVKGRLEFVGNCEGAVRHYQQTGRTSGQDNTNLADFRPPNMRPVFRRVALLDGEGNPTTNVFAGAPLTVEMEFDSPVPFKDPAFGVCVETGDGDRLFHLHSRVQHGNLHGLAQRGVARCHVPFWPLIPGTYTLSFTCGSHREYIDFLDRAITIEVEEADCYNSGWPPWTSRGPFLVPAKWTVASPA